MDNLSMSIQLYASSKIFEKEEEGGCLLWVDWIVGELDCWRSVGELDCWRFVGELDCWRSVGKLEEFGGSMGGGGGEGIWWGLLEILWVWTSGWWVSVVWIDRLGG